MGYVQLFISLLLGEPLLKFYFEDGLLLILAFDELCAFLIWTYITRPVALQRKDRRTQERTDRQTDMPSLYL
jgi:hypothetical protein